MGEKKLCKSQGIISEHEGFVEVTLTWGVTLLSLMYEWSHGISAKNKYTEQELKNDSSAQTEREEKKEQG